MSKRFAALLTAVCLLVLGSATAVAAGNVVHYQFVDTEHSVMTMDDTLAECVGYSGVITEERTYDVRVMEFIDGPRAGRVHLTGAILGDFTIEPSDPDAEPTFSGSYREKVTFIGTSLDDPLVFSFSVPATATGTDGSRLKFLLHGHGVITEDGEVRNLTFKFRCIQPGA